jgi:hypothetical protein
VKVGATTSLTQGETHEALVVYRPLYNTTGLWLRPHAMFFETVVIDGVQRARFEPVPD